MDPQRSAETERDEGQEADPAGAVRQIGLRHVHEGDAQDQQAHRGARESAQADMPLRATRSSTGWPRSSRAREKPSASLLA